MKPPQAPSPSEKEQKKDPAQDRPAQGAVAGKPMRDIEKQDTEAVLDAFERVEPTVQKDLARRKAGNRHARKDW